MEAEKLFLLFFLIMLQFSSCTSQDSLKTNQTIKDGDLLISKGNIFALGFSVLAVQPIDILEFGTIKYQNKLWCGLQTGTIQSVAQPTRALHSMKVIKLH